MGSTDSPEIPDRGETSDIPGLPSGVVQLKTVHTAVNIGQSQFTAVTACKFD